MAPQHGVRHSKCVLRIMYRIKLTMFDELPKNTGKHNDVLQNYTATRNSVRMEQPVRKMLHISHTSANVHLRLPENTVKPVSCPFCSFFAAVVCHFV